MAYNIAPRAVKLDFTHNEAIIDGVRVSFKVKCIICKGTVGMSHGSTTMHCLYNIAGPTTYFTQYPRTIVLPEGV